MAVKPILSKAAIKLVESLVSELFARAKKRYLGPWVGGKTIVFSPKAENTLPGLFMAAARDEGAVPDKDIVVHLIQNASNYLDAYEAKAKAQVVNEVGAFLHEAHKKGIDTDFETVLGGKLADVWADTSKNVKRLVETEATSARNLGTLEGITKVNASQDIEDPIVFFVVVRDDSLCSECKRLHLMPDGVTPRCWKLSEIGHGYHKKGQNEPKVSGLHPNCRCTMATLMPGYGFDESGMVEFKELEHDEFEKQSKLSKAEALAKSDEGHRVRIPISNVYILNRWGHPLNAERVAYQVQHGHLSPPVKARLGTSFEVNNEQGDYVHAFNPQTEYDDGSYDPSSVKMDPSHPKYFLTDGHHRLQAAKERGETHIDADVSAGETPHYLSPEKKLVHQQELESERAKLSSHIAAGMQKYEPHDCDLHKVVLDPNAGYRFEIAHHDDMRPGSAKQIKGMTVTAYHPSSNEPAGRAVFRHDGRTRLYPQDTYVDPGHRRKGLASAMYAHAEGQTGRKIVPSKDQTTAGKALWQGNRREKQFGKSEEDDFEDLQKSLPTHQFEALLADMGWTKSRVSKEHYYEHPTVTHGAHGIEGRTRHLVLGHNQQHSVPDHKMRGVLADAGLRLVNGKLEAKPGHPYYKLYQESGHAPMETSQEKTWMSSQPAEGLQSIPMDKLISTKETHPGHWQVSKHKVAMAQGKPVPHITALAVGDGTYMIDHGDEVHEAAKQAGMTHAPVLVKT